VSQARFQKQQREKARREKAAAKFARKEQRRSDADSVERVEPEAGGETEAKLLADLAALHERFGNEEMTFDDFTLAKEELMERLSALTS
jgi:hypothetical protein